MDILFFALLCLLYLAASGLALVGQVHIFQLNSYKPKVQRDWINKNSGAIAARSAIALAALPLLLWCGAAGMAGAAAAFLAAGLLNLPKKAKKPLVYTKRVWRLLGTLAVLYLIPVLAAALLPGARMYVCMVFAPLLFLAPYMVLLANHINKPIERGINNGFINDAKRRIAASPRLTVVGVTGSYGKTSVKFYLGKLLSAKYNVLVTPESYNTTLGVVRTIRERLDATHDVFVCEMGARNPGDIREICDIVHPSCGVVTSIGPAHLESFKSMENIVRTKFELIDSLPKDGTAFLNMDNDYIAARAVPVKAVGYGVAADADFRAHDITVSERGTAFKLRTPDGTDWDFSTQLIGEHNVQNIAGAIAAAATLGVPMADIAMQVRRLEAVPHRLQLIRGGGKIVIDDAYNSNPAGAKAALDTLARFSGCRIMVTPGMVELGAAHEEKHLEFGREAADACDFVVLVGEKRTRPIRAGLLERGFDTRRVIVRETLKEALAAVERIDAQGRVKVVLLENDLPDNY